MKLVPGFYWILLMAALGLGACGKEKINLQWVEQNTNTSADLTSVFFLDENRGFATGGEVWSRAVVTQTTNGGMTWVTDSIGPKQALSIHFTDGDRGHAVGIDGLLYVKEQGDPNWITKRLSRWDTHRSVAFYGAEGIIVSGGAYQNGVIQKVGANYVTEVIDTFENELSTVCFSDANTVHVAGYGLVLRSTDAGRTWEKNSIEGDFFRDLCFPSTQVGYLVGSTGSILKTRDAGLNWEWQRRGEGILVNDKGFKAVHFVDELRGYVVGNKGLFWRTLDGGENWEVDQNFPEVDFQDVFVIGTSGYVVAKGGRIFKFEDPQ